MIKAPADQQLDLESSDLNERFSFKKPVINGKDHYVKWWLEIFLSELMGTFFLMYFGCMSPFLYDDQQLKMRRSSVLDLDLEQTTVLRYSLSWGFIISSVITCIGHISKAHLNPAVTLCAFLLGHISLSTALVYIVSEILGCILGVFGLMVSIPQIWYRRYDELAQCGLCCTCLHERLDVWQGLLLEFVATSVLIYVVCSIWDWRNERWSDSTAIKFALTISFLCMCIGPLTGASMNPARSFAPALIHWKWTDHWVYWLSPLSASVITTLFYRYVHRMKVIRTKDSYRNTL